MATTINAGRVRFVLRGTYNNSTQYYLFDLVDYNGSSYIAKENTVGNLPTNTTYWQLIAEKGNTGNDGQQGPIGLTGNGIASIEKTGTSGLVDTYTITYTNGNTTTFTVTNGEDGDVTQTQFEALQEEVTRLKGTLRTTTGTGENITLDKTAELNFVKPPLPRGNTTQNTVILPAEYQQVEYIKSNGTEYIDTGYSLPTKPKIETKLQFNKTDSSLVNNNSIFGVMNNNVPRAFALNFGSNNNNNNDIFYWNGVGYSNGERIKQITLTLEFLNASHIYTLDNTGLKIDDTMYSKQGAEVATTDTIKLFTYSVNGTVNNNTKVKLYYAKIYDNNVLVRDLIPCYRKSDNEIGLYDLVNRVFYTNAGTGTFTKGSNISLPNSNYPIDIQVVKGNNNVKIQNKNYLDISKCVMGANNTTVNTTITYSTKTNRACTKFDVNPIYVKPNTTYTIKRDSNYNFSVAQLTSNNIVISDSGWKSANFSFTTSSNCQKITLNFKKNNDANFTIEEFKTVEFQLEEGSTATTYEAHQGQELPLDLPVENLLENSATTSTQNGITFTVNSDGTIIANGTSTALAQISILWNKTFKKGIYTISECKAYISSDAYTGWFDGQENSTTKEFTTDFTITACYVQIANGTTVSNKIFKPQLEKGSKANAFTPYGTTPIELCKIGDNQDYFYKSLTNGIWYKHEEVEKLIVDGVNFRCQYMFPGGYFLLHDGNGYPDRWKKVPTQETLSSILSSYLIKTPARFITSLYKQGIAINNEGRIIIKLDDADEETNTWTAETLNIYFANNNLIVYAPLEEPKDIPITNTTLINQLEAINNATSYEGQTNISGTSGGENPLFDVEAYQSTKLLLEDLMQE